MNFINCAYQVENGQGYLVAEGGRRAAPVDDKRRRLLEAAGNADQLVLGIRPEHLTLQRRKPTRGRALAGHRSYAIEPLGPKTIVHLKVGDDLDAGRWHPAAYRPRAR